MSISGEQNALFKSPARRHHHAPSSSASAQHLPVKGNHRDAVITQRTHTPLGDARRSLLTGRQAPRVPPCSLRRVHGAERMLPAASPSVVSFSTEDRGGGAGAPIPLCAGALPLPYNLSRSPARAPIDYRAARPSKERHRGLFLRSLPRLACKAEPKLAKSLLVQTHPRRRMHNPTGGRSRADLPGGNRPRTATPRKAARAAVKKRKGNRLPPSLLSFPVPATS